MPELITVQQGREWWIMGPGYDCGPYDTKAEAEEDRRGMTRTYRLAKEPNYVTMDAAG